MWLRLLLPALLGAAPGAADGTEVTRPRGVPLSHLHFYEDPDTFTCLDGSATVSSAWVNDDYCDCRDGSDEPGTSACPNGSFHCRNAGHRPRSIAAGRVNDGVCDCCDGTDEYESGAACEDTCKELGRREREDMQRVAAVARDGFRLKQQLVQEAAQSRQEQEARLAELRGSRGGISDRVAALRAAKEAAEGPERAARDEQRRRWQEQQAAAEATEATETFGRLDTDGDGLLTVPELQGHPELDGDGDGAVSQDEAQALLGGDTAPVDVVTFRQHLWGGIKERLGTQGQPDAPPSPAPPPEETPSPEEEDEEEEEEEEDDEAEGPEEELKVPPSQVPEGKGPQEPPPPEPPYDAATQALIDAAQRAREELEEAERSLKDTDESIRALEQELGFDFGPQGEFSYLYRDCYELETGEYIYRLCPFKRVSQKPKHGGSETNLGTWGSWSGPEHDRFSAMRYEQGTGCWQGPSRSTTVRLTCGTRTAVTATAEPSRCEYLMELVTPAACGPPPPGGHDEL